MRKQIHIHAERLRGNKWEHYAPSVWPGVNGDLFDILAGEGHGNYSPIAPPRGAPANVSQEVANKYRSIRNPRSASWLLVEELNTYQWPIDGYLGIIHDQWVKSLQMIGHPCMVRVIYWFSD